MLSTVQVGIGEKFKFNKTFFITWCVFVYYSEMNIDSLDLGKVKAKSFLF